MGHFGGSEGGIGEGGARDWAARVGLRGERGCAGEPVAREGGMLCAVRRYRLFQLTFGVFEHFGPSFENYFLGCRR